MHQDKISPGCVLEGGLGKRNWASKDCSLRRLGRNLLVVISRFMHSENGKLLAGSLEEDGPIPLSLYTPCAVQTQQSVVFPSFVTLL